MTEASHPDWLEPVQRLAEQAGEQILAVYESADFQVESKADDTPLTRADRAAHEVIEAGLRDLAPRVPQLSEEGDEVAAAERGAWGLYWLIDPLDGTREFIKRNGEFTVNIALVEGGEPVLGVVHAPVLGTTWSACRGRGAWRVDGGEVEAIATRRAEPPLTAVVSRSHREDAVADMLARLGEVEELSVGSSLKICRIAEGAADLYPRFGPTCEWDTGAAQCVLEAAGGQLLDVGLTPLRYNTGESLLNPDFIAVGDPAFDWAAVTEGLAWEARRVAPC